MNYMHRKISFAFSSIAMSAGLCLTGCDDKPDNPPEPPVPATAVVPEPQLPQDGMPQAVNFLEVEGAFVRVAAPDDVMHYEAQHWGREAKPHEATLMADPANAALFQDFMQRFDAVKDASLREKANAVNEIINGYVTYHSDKYNYDAIEYFASAIETLKLQSGDCEDYAIFKYRVLKALGVTDDRLFITTVNAEGNSDGSDHVVLIVDVADKGAQPDYVMLENGENMRRPGDSGYSFYTAFNDSGYWRYDRSATLPANMHPAPRTQVVDNSPPYVETQKTVLDNGAVLVEKDGTIIVNNVVVTTSGGSRVTINHIRISPNMP